MKNRLFAALSPQDRILLKALRPVDLPVRTMLEPRGKPIQHVYFLDDGIASVVALGRRKSAPMEVGIIGSEGVTGISILLGNHTPVNETYMQVAGSGQRIDADAFRAALQASATLRDHLLKFANVFMIQTTQTAVANGAAALDERLARWLLMAQDRVNGSDLVLTHEFLAQMLAVTRPGVTLALGEFVRRGLIKTARSHITMIDRDQIEKIAGDFYGVPEREFERIVFDRK